MDPVICELHVTFKAFMGPGLFQRVHTQAVYQVVHQDGDINGGYEVKACRPVTFCRILRIIEAFKKLNKKQNSASADIEFWVQLVDIFPLHLGFLSVHGVPVSV